MVLTPTDEYRTRLGRLAAADRAWSRLDKHLSYGRLAAFAAGVAVLLVAWRGAAPWWAAALPFGLFGALALRHDRVIRERSRVARSSQFYERGLARLEDRWSGTGASGDRFRDDTHPYSNDLDLFGRGSLFELLSTARTRAGENVLAFWLTHPSLPGEILARQQAAAELAPALDLRERIALAGTEVEAAVNSEALVTWAEGTPIFRARWLWTVAAVLTAATVGTAVYAFMRGDYTPLVAVLIAEAVCAIPQRARIQRALHAADGPARDLDVLAHILGELERERFTAARLDALRAGLKTPGGAASSAIRRLHRLVELHDWQHNQFFAPIAAAFLWGTHLAWAIERWRRLHGGHVRGWLDTVGEFEALCAIAAYRYEHAADVWPSIVNGEVRFEATAIGHPLIPSARSITNDIRLSESTRLLVVSGSNMSGKSTLLRTVGINAVLALAGAPVRAAALQLTPVAISATLRIQDSLQEGRSRFYAEVTRIRVLSDLANGPLPLLFLLDELFHGTNSRDRLVGASAVLRSLIDRGAIGLVTTHDLALTAIADDLAPRAANVHFEDRFEGGEFHFDYRIRPGPVTHSNAVALMRAVGLQVDSTDHHD